MRMSDTSPVPISRLPQETVEEILRSIVTNEWMDFDPCDIQSMAAELLERREAQRPRPMTEAPQEGPVIVATKGGQRIARRIEGEWFSIPGDYFIQHPEGWWPLPTSSIQDGTQEGNS